MVDAQSDYLNKPLRELVDVLGLRPPLPAARKIAMLAALKTAHAAAEAGDYAHARLFLADAQEHLRALGTK
jgi:hypothetical protein